MKIKKLIIHSLFWYYNVILSLDENEKKDENEKNAFANVYSCSIIADDLCYFYCEPDKIFVGDGDEKDFFIIIY